MSRFARISKYEFWNLNKISKIVITFDKKRERWFLEAHGLSPSEYKGFWMFGSGASEIFNQKDFSLPFTTFDEANDYAMELLNVEEKDTKKKD